MSVAAASGLQQDLLWAKALAEDPEQFHPLHCHLIDVAEVVGAMWRDVFPAALRKTLSNATGLPEPDTARWLAFWAGLHDIGKASPGFQALSTARAEALKAAGLPVGSSSHIHHGVITARVLPDLFARSAPGGHALRPEVVASLALAVGGHHGIFPAVQDVGPAALGGPLWDAARKQVFVSLAEVELVSNLDLPRGLSAQDHRFFMLLAGITSVADWIGSAAEHFPYEPQAPEPSVYASEAAGRAAAALKELGWTQWHPLAETVQFDELLAWATPGDEKPSPRPMQRAVVAEAEKLPAPGLVLIEAPMGEGKTEAAFYLADCWNTRLQQRGCYLALPTQATANAMFRRFVDNYLHPRYEGMVTDVHLLHGQAALSVDYQQLRDLARTYDVDENDTAAASAVVAHEWFAQRKRGLLGPFAVGTIDQALLAALQTKHAFVRLFGLAGKTVILDEVHAFDTYTSTLIDRLLEWLSALDCSVVLLSATLPRARREHLLRAYAGKNVEVPHVAYPRVTTICAGEATAVTFDCAAKEMALRWVPGEAQALATRIREATPDGGCVAVVCNTVRRAQELYRALREEFDGTATEVDLFHARYPFFERDRREKRAIQRFGKGGDRPKSAVLVATQVIEQSLDVDFDLMVTELAPIDLVLQRSGRMHRHNIPRPPGLAEPCLWVMEPGRREDGQPEFGHDAYVYGEYLLLKTWCALQGRESIGVPEDVEDLIERVYSDEEPDLGPELMGRLREAAVRAAEKREKLNYEAKTRLLQAPSFDDDFPFFPHGDPHEEDDPTVHRAFQALTRYSDTPSISVVCLRDGDAGDQTAWLETAAGRLAISLDQKPDDDAMNKLMEQSVNLSGAAARYFIGQDAPAGWRQAPMLRFMRAAVFNDEGVIEAGSITLRLDEELGIVVVRGDTEGGSV
jgi:CRISPR-associated endonuclease/helicase Cas3